MKLAFDEYPIKTYIGPKYPAPRRKDLTPDETIIKVPSLIVSNMSLFICKHPEKMLQVLKDTIWTSKTETVCPRLKYVPNNHNNHNNHNHHHHHHNTNNPNSGYLPREMWHGVRLAWGSLRANRFDWIFSLISDILAKSTPGSFYHCTKYQSNGFDYACFNEHWASTEFWSSKYFSAAQMLKLANTFFDFLLKYRPSPEVFYYFLILAIYIYPCTLQIFRPMLLGICP